MNLLASIGSQKIRRIVQFRANPGASLLSATDAAGDSADTGHYRVSAV
jgi:hypothetical protein